jgi:mono/diheme cytochrome c family protein
MRALALSAVAALSLLLTGCGGKEDYSAPEDTSAETMFQQACAHCHGEAGAGKFGFLLGLRESRIPADNVARMIANGRGIMPAFPELSETQRQRLAEYAAGLSDGSGE